MEADLTPAVRRRDDPPRLVLRFAIATGIALALAAAAILLVVRHYNTVQAERGAASQARVIAGTVLRGNLAASDFDRAARRTRRSALDDLLRHRALSEGVLLVELYSPGGIVTYSSDHRLIGTRPSGPIGHLREAAAGTIRSDVTRIRSGAGERKVLRTYAPVAVPGGQGLVGIFQDYRPIAEAASATFLPVVGIFEAVLLLLFVALAPILRRVTVRLRRQMEEIERRAYYDELTGLPNRALYRDRIEQAILAAQRDGDQATLMLLDVDRFKEVNDTLGHDTGDLLLQELARRLRETLRTNETLARLGGDEFGILLPGASVEEAMFCAARIHAAFEAPFTLRGLALAVRTSVGIAAFPEHGEDLDELLQHADVAMYVAKDARAGTSIYDAAEDENDAARLALAGELRRAIEDDELVLHFQPIAELGSGEIVGAEALVRWDHPERGFIQPGDFIPLAERMGLLNPLSRHVVESALRQCAAWNASGLALRVSVNLTIPDFLDLELPEWIAELLSESGVRPEQLELEITEGTILADPFRVRQVLKRLNELGVSLAIDDFGTGYSSLAYLKRLPVQRIKIDRSFVHDMCADASDATIVRSTIDLGRNLGLEIVGEGVESREAWHALRSLGCTLAQGYFIGRAMPADQFVDALAAAPVMPGGTGLEAVSAGS
jgi:diguanylate cyclase (GGDEF)-like protein